MRATEEIRISSGSLPDHRERLRPCNGMDRFRGGRRGEDDTAGRVGRFRGRLPANLELDVGGYGARCGPSGTAIRTGKMAICRNMLVDPAFAPWREEAQKRGYASSVVLPLLIDGKAFGEISIYSPEPDPFSDEEVKLLGDLAEDLVFGIQMIRTRVGMHAEERTRLLSEVTAELSASDQPQQIVETLCRKVMEHLDCHVFFNFLVDEQSAACT